MSHQLKCIISDVKDHECRQRLSVVYRGTEIAWGLDCGEPEDNRFGKDYAWIRPAIEKAYKLGLKDGNKK